MLTKNSMKASSSAAVELARSKIKLRPASGSPLAELVKATYDEVIYSLESSIKWSEVSTFEDLFKNHLEPYLTTQSGSSSSEANLMHDNLQDEVIGIYSKALIKQFDFIKNQIIPTIDEIITSLNKTLDGFINSDPMSKACVVIATLPDVLNEATLSNRVSNAINVKSGPEPLFEIYFDKVTEELASSVKDEMFAIYGSKWESIQKLSIDFIARTLKDLYSVTEEISEAKIIERINLATMAYLVIDTVLNNQDLLYKLTSKTVTEVQLSGYRDICNKYFLSVVASTLHIFENIYRVDGIRAIVEKIDYKNSIVVVEKENYTKWLSEGNSSDLILSLLFRETNDFENFTAKYFEDNKDTLLKERDTYLDFNRNYNTMNLFNSFKKYFTFTFDMSMNKKTPVEEEYYSKNPNAYYTVKKIFDEELGKVKLKDIKDEAAIYDTCYKIIAKSRFFFTNAEDILEHMKVEGEIMKTDNVSNVAAVAAISYLVDHLVSQIKFD